MKIYREIKHSNKTTVAVTIAITGTLCPACKQTDKQRMSYKSFFLLCTGPAQCNEKSLTTLSVISAETKTSNCLPDIFFYTDIMNFTAINMTAHK